MSVAESLTRYDETERALQAYVSALPLWINVWRGWMFFVFTLGIVFVIGRVEARSMAVTMIASLFGFNLVAMFHGVGRFPSIAFVALWSPLAMYFARRRPQLVVASRFDRVYAWWLTIALATLVVSLSFDIYNVVYSVIMQVP